MKLTAQPPTPAPITVEVTPKAAIEALRQEFFKRLNQELEQLGVHQLHNEHGWHYERFYCKEGKLYGFYEDGRAPRNQEYRHQIEYGVQQWMPVFIDLNRLQEKAAQLLVP